METASEDRTPPLHQQITIVPLSDAERSSGTLTEENLATAISAVHRDGIVVLENAVPPEHADELNKILMSEAEYMAKLPTTHFNENSIDGKPTGNMSQGPPLDPSIMYTSIWANLPAANVLQYILGPSPKVNYVNGNTALGNFNGARQRVHADLSFNHGLFPFAIVTNYYLTDVSPANASTELWLASHRDTSFADHRNCFYGGPSSGADEKELLAVFGIKDERIEARRKIAPPIQPVVKKGSVIIRDLRLWHAGLSNPSPDPRIMLAFVHTPAWYQCPARVVLPEAARGLVEEWRKQKYPVDYYAYFVPEEMDHKRVKFNPNFSSKNKGYLAMLPDLPPGFIFGEDEEAGVVTS